MDAIAKTEAGRLSTRDLLLQRYYLPEEREVHLRDYWRIILKRRWTVLTFFVIIATTLTIHTFTLTPSYRASAIIKIDRDRPQILSFQDVGLPPNPGSYDDDFMGTHHKLLQSRSLAKRVVDKFNGMGQPVLASQQAQGPSGLKSLLLSWVRYPFSRQRPDASQPVDPNLAAERAQSGSLDAVLGMLAVEPVKGSQLVKITFTSPSPSFSTLLANTWAKAYIDQSLEFKYNATTQAREWLSRQLEEVLAKLEQSETKLHDFAREKGILTIGEKKDFVTAKFAALSEAMTKAQGERISKEALYRQSQGLGFEAIPLVLENSLISNLKNEYYKLDSEYQRLSETYKPNYPKMIRMREGITQIKRRLDTEIRRVILAIKEDYEASMRKEKLLQAAVDDQKRLVIKLTQDFTHYDILKREVDTNHQIYASILERQKQAGVSQGLATSNVQIVDLAETPFLPFSPNKSRTILLGIALGLAVGIGLAFFFDYLDNTVKSPEELERALGIPSLGLIPALSSVTPRKEVKGAQNGRPVFELIAHRDLHSILTEAFRTLRTSILYSSPESPPKSILITSAQPREGKTGTAMNTAITFSQLGSTVLLIDADMRRPCCHRFLRLPLKPGLSDYLTGHAELFSIVNQTSAPHLFCIPAGTTPVNPAELLASSRMKETLDLLAQRFDYIIVDSPPVLGVADALILSTQVNGVILVTHGGRTPREMVQHAIKNLLELNANIIGTVLNNLDIRGNGYPYHYKYQYYGKASDSSHEAPFEKHGVVDDDRMARKGGDEKTA